ncbi:MAG: thioredoxin family protein [Alphaproteobacteria bacterium]|nr:thioredoxin family protein [Alphaproteobacteria bacterium]
MAAQPPICDFGWPAPDFELPGTDGRTYRLSDIRGRNGTLVMFLSNHCPYVQAVADRIARDCAELVPQGVASIGIMSNDVESYPDDSPANMKLFAKRHGYPFPYVYDESQAVARAYDAVCTPDFFGFNADLKLQYRGRLDASRRDLAPPGSRRELFDAMLQIARTGEGPQEQIPSMGCSIKWKETV